MKIETLERKFQYNGVTLNDPGAHMNAEQVKDFYSAAYPELATAVVEGPEERDGKLLFSFRKSVGTKA